MREAEPDLDATDERILELLRRDARRPYRDIGARVGLSAPAVKRRVDRLRDVGILTGFTTVVDHAKLGLRVEAFAELRFIGTAPVDAIEGIGAEVPEIQGIFTIAGDPDALAWIRVRDVDELKRVVDRIRRTGKVTGTKTLMVLGSVVRSPI